MVNDANDSIDELETMNDEDPARILEETRIVRATVTKLHKLAFAIINSTTISLPAWRCVCKVHKLVSKLMFHIVSAMKLACRKLN
jgi:hypothetical protein